MVENYFNMIAGSNTSDEIEISANVLELSGIIQLPNDLNLKEFYLKHLVEKYGS